MAAYLRSVPPVRNAVTERSRYSFPLQAYGPPVTSVPELADDPVARGAYIAWPVAHCLDCHSSRLPNGQVDPGRLGAQGLSFTGLWGTAVSRNITPHPDTGVGRWSDAQIIRALREEIGGDGRPLMPPMGRGRGRVWAAMSEQDMTDLIAYLRSHPRCSEGAEYPPCQALHPAQVRGWRVRASRTKRRRPLPEGRSQ